ncbi:MAG: hypothetical protein A3C02_00800 [Candidatus Andersenbacteria bacterium RIFCSPHIGHO2_02_FULL_45_11]|uniref:DNA alkylation repair protein n=1 Tax=Candidatus Andersenbacteria bacterium RIFCSPHIGHO2_12_FULL_45_11 TaxID=1797281 RepID=A0A1G1X5T7_9BACT|nr:MAG: hypothetical protein A2805_01625 [Candidatus Andersenbacteria bacterium RIFCSPHIGHO2_01_FULL_46_36]OGY33323.1 MAG: hypothetical protein A3C02_00800 [Candidatus Andersenbacteria bacterium RIFCSPHIGHO2_02_FULL_45_11]OGY34677.1 MAG: hypothetical protein A3D99_05045 [Candidatus Andersenbacteria bacterium RIFCSPHIGHO2_12_FULL_45_11]
MISLLESIHSELKLNADPAYKKSQQRFFKEGIELYGVRIPIVRKIASKFFRKIERSPAVDASHHFRVTIFALCEELLKTNMQEDSVIVYDFAYRMRTEFEPKDFVVFDRWVKNYVNNWAKCDDLCTGALGELLATYPQLIQKTVPWRKSKNRWVRRASAVALIVPIKRSNTLPDVFAAADALMADEDDLVRKGYGWLLKEASNIYPNEVFAYVMKNKAKMSRVALRYAIEKMPKDWKRQAMAKL